MNDEKKEKGFTVTDRRLDAEDGEAKKPEEIPAAAPPAGAAEPETEAKKQKERPPIMPVTFPTFLLSLHTSVLFHLGLLPAPGAEKIEVDLGAARQNIDILEILEQKTKGNLNPEETDLLTNILYEARMAYVQMCEKANKGECKP